METGTDFGFRQVPKSEKSRRVRSVFDSVARRYDVMNDLMSAGLPRHWKAAFVGWLKPRPYMRVLDLAGGTGDIAFRFLKSGGGHVTVADINQEMLSVGTERAERRNLSGNIQWVCASGEDLPLPNASMDVVTCAFGIRNMTEKDLVLREISRVLRPGGRFLCLEFSRIVLPGLEPLYDKYSLDVVPRLGRLVVKDEESYRYLAESIRTFPCQNAFAEMISNAGLSRVGFRNLSGGITAMHSAWKI